MDNIARIKRKPRPLQATYEPNAPYVVEREDQEDGSIRYMVFDRRPETYRYVCSTNDDGGRDSDAKRDAEMIARGLNLLVQYGLERVKRKD